MDTALGGSGSTTSKSSRKSDLGYLEALLGTSILRRVVVSGSVQGAADESKQCVSVLRNTCMKPIPYTGSPDDTD